MIITIMKKARPYRFGFFSDLMSVLCVKVYFLIEKNILIWYNRCNKIYWRMACSVKNLGYVKYRENGDYEEENCSMCQRMEL